MEKIINLLKGEKQDLAKALEILRNKEKDANKIKNYRSEIYELNRKIRNTQIGNLIKDKTIKKDDGHKLVRKVRVPIPFPKKIIQTATAFEFGKPVNITYAEETELNHEVLKQWKSLRLDSKLQKLTIHKKTETESCLVFYFTGKGQDRKMKSKVYSSVDGKMIPYYDEEDDMKYFTWKFEEKIGEKVVTKYWVYDKEFIYKIVSSGNGYSLDDDPVKHGFDKIPVVYVDQDEVEYFDVKEMIDRYEVALSKLGNSNDYSGHPMLFFKGKVQGMPDKDDDGKVLQSPIEIDSNGKEHVGDAKFLTHDNAPKSVEFEVDKLESLIYSMTSTPDVSFSNLKGIGNIASHSMELMFLDAKMKAMLNEGDNRTTVERCLSIIVSGMVNTKKTSTKSQRDKAIFDIIFESILPNNLVELVDTMSKAHEKGIVSTETAVSKLNLITNQKEELERLKIAKNKEED